MIRTGCVGQALGLGLLCACASSLAQGADSGISLSTGVEYSSGGYGGTDDIEEIYAPVTGVFSLDRLAFSVTVPYLSVSAPSGTTVTEPGGEPVSGSGAMVTESGLGDVVLGLTIYDVFLDIDRGIAIDITGKVKIGTADIDKGLGTGEEDYLLRADMYKFFDQFTLMGSAGYKVRGEPPGVDLSNSLLGSIGGSYALNDKTSVGFIYDYRDSSFEDGDPLSEATLFSMHRLSESLHLQLYAFAGFSDSSPDWGAGVYLSVN